MKRLDKEQGAQEGLSVGGAGGVGGRCEQSAVSPAESQRQPFNTPWTSAVWV